VIDQIKEANIARGLPDLAGDAGDIGGTIEGTAREVDDRKALGHFKILDGPPKMTKHVRKRQPQFSPPIRAHAAREILSER
jgi:hypothetical protein